MYKDGRGVPQDYVQAHMWANLAAARGVAAIADMLDTQWLSKMRLYYSGLRDELAGLMTLGQIAEAQAMATAWRPAIGKSGDNKRAEPPEIVAGTGFFINPHGYVLTNNHVVSGCAQVSVFPSTGEQTVPVFARDIGNDLAVVGPLKTTPTALAFALRPRLGQNVVVVGYPLQGILASSINVTTGTVSAIAGLNNDTRMIQFTAPVQAGNSGGPL